MQRVWFENFNKETKRITFNLNAYKYIKKGKDPCKLIGDITAISSILRI